MKVPSGFHGTEGEAKRYARSLVKQTEARRGLHEVDLGDLIGLRDVPGSIVIERTGAVPGEQRRIWAYPLPALVLGKLGLDGLRRLASELLGLEWGGLMLLGPDSMPALREPWFPGALVEWAYAHFGELVEIEDRIASPTGGRRSLWLPPTNLHRALGFFGVEDARLYRPTREEFRELLVWSMNTRRWSERPQVPRLGLGEDGS